MNQATPRYPHGCSKCVFLGTYRGHDLYFCEQSGALPTVLARYGREAPAYTSGLILAERDTILREALRLAMERGLVGGS